MTHEKTPKWQEVETLGVWVRGFYAEPPSQKHPPCILGTAEVSTARPAGSKGQWEETASEKALGAAKTLDCKGAGKSWQWEG